MFDPILPTGLSWGRWVAHHRRKWPSGLYVSLESLGLRRVGESGHASAHIDIHKS